MNSGITRVEDTDNSYAFFGSSGSSYVCRKGYYGAHSLALEVLESLAKKAKTQNIEVMVLAEDTNWEEIEYEKSF